MRDNGVCFVIAVLATCLVFTSVSNARPTHSQMAHPMIEGKTLVGDATPLFEMISHFEMMDFVKILRKIQTVTSANLAI